MKTRSLKMVVLPLVALVMAQGCQEQEGSLLPKDVSYSAAPSQGALHRVHHRGGPRTGEVASAVIGSEGGSLTLGQHRLLVPASAVSYPTRFELSLAENEFVQVELRASSYTRGQAGADVGRRGFSKPVTLELSYADAASVTGTEMVIVWVRPDGSLQPIPSVRDTARNVVSAELSHFSPYALASD